MDDIFFGMPTKVKVGCFYWNIVTVSDKEADIANYWGATQPQHLTISLRQSITDPTQLANTFIHEVLHAIHYVFGLIAADQDETCDSPSEEEYTTLGANGLLAFWQDNPEAVKWWENLVNRE